MKTLFERFGEVFNPNYSTKQNDKMIIEEMTGIEMLEELANSHCEECGCDLSDCRSMESKYCKECYSEMNRQDIAFERQRGN